MEDMPDLPVSFPTMTYLQEVAIEGQELFRELRNAGFTERQATNIVAQMVLDALDSRDDDDYAIVYMESDEDDDDLDDEDDLYDDRDPD